MAHRIALLTVMLLFLLVPRQTLVGPAFAGSYTSDAVAIAQLADRILDLETADGAARQEVKTWLARSAEDILRAGTATPPAASSRPSTGFLPWLRTFTASGKTADWKLSQIARSRRGSCLGLVCAGVLVGRLAGLDVSAIAVPDHLLLQVRADGSETLIELLEHVRTLGLTDARLRYRVPDPGKGFLRSLSDEELLACIRIERGAESLEAGRVHEAERDFRTAMRDFPDHPSGFYNQGLLEGKRQDWDAAERLLSEAVLRNDLDARIWYSRSLARSRLRRWRQAISDANQALLLNPQMQEAIDLRSVITESSAKP